MSGVKQSVTHLKRELVWQRGGEKISDTKIGYWQSIWRFSAQKIGNEKKAEQGASLLMKDIGFFIT